ncbi:MAG: TonB-dependent receptor plug domain-containing protein [Proteobacteria bacterium]|nr:TonB-dependent receptor plug domain-containing protein [Pseudomonadota bacterium]
MRWNRINTADIQRIDIFKGPGSSIYGSNAMGGVINIITQSPKKTFEGKVSAGYGSYNTRKGSVRLAGKQAGETGFLGQIAATGLKSDGFTLYGCTKQPIPRLRVALQQVVVWFRVIFIFL